MLEEEDSLRMTGGAVVEEVRLGRPKGWMTWDWLVLGNRDFATGVPDPELETDTTSPLIRRGILVPSLLRGR